MLLFADNLPSAAIIERKYRLLVAAVVVRVLAVAVILALLVAHARSPIEYRPIPCYPIVAHIFHARNADANTC